MKRFLSVVSILSVLALATSALAFDFGWTLSGSNTDPMVNTGSPSAGVVSIYLWYYCTNTAEGLASAEFDITGSSLPLAFTAMNGFLNAGGATNLLLAVGGCPAGPLLAGSFLVNDLGSGFNLCISPSASNGLNVSVNCVALQIYENDFIGYTSDGTTPCQSFTTELCETPVSATSWGNIKSLYR